MALAVLLSIAALAATEQDVLNLIAQLPFSSADKAFLTTSYKKGMDEGRLAPDVAMDLLQKVGVQNNAPVDQRKDVLVTIGQALLEELPVDMLISKAEEGVAKGVPMSDILQEIQERKATLEQVKALFDQRGIHSNVTDRSSPYSQPIIDAAITDVAGSLEDYVRGGNNPNDATAVKAAVLNTLKLDGRLPTTLVSAIDEHVSEIDLDTIAQTIAARIKNS
jgi:nucleotide-binding universal stress UspA family protein